MGNGKVRGVGIAMAMQGSSIAGVDVASVSIKVNDDGFYSMTIGAAEMGTGCDTTLAQVAAECLDCEIDDIVVYGADTDISPLRLGLLRLQHGLPHGNGRGQDLRVPETEDYRQGRGLFKLSGRRPGI